MMFKTTYLTQLTDVDTTDREGVGTLRFENNKMYKYVKYDDGTADLDVVAGNVAGYLAGGVDDSFVTADVTDMDAQPVMAGLFLGAVTETDRYIWIQVGGVGTLASTVEGTTPAAGDTVAIKAGTTDKFAEVDPLVSEVVGGFMITATTTIFLQCPSF